MFCDMIDQIIEFNIMSPLLGDAIKQGKLDEMAWKDAHWEEDLQKAFDAGKRMAEKQIQ